MQPDMTTPNEHEQLRALAEMATSGPWIIGGSGRVISTMLDGRHIVAESDRTWGPNRSGANAAYIAAANPQAVLSLLDQLAALREENEGLRQREEIAQEIASTHLDRWGAAEQRAEAAEARVAKLEEERDHYKRKTACVVGLSYAKTGERITVYAEDKRSLDLLIHEPGIVETLRDVEKQIAGGHAKRIEDIDSPPKARAVLSEEVGS